MKGVYIKLVLLGLLVIVPAGGAILYNDYTRLDRLLDQQQVENLKYIGAQIQESLPLPADVLERFDAESRRILSSHNRVTTGARIVQAGLYKRVGTDDDYKLLQSVPIDKKSVAALMSVTYFKPAEMAKLRRIDRERTFCAVPISAGKSPDYVVQIQALDETRAAFLQKAVLRNGAFWGIAFIALLLFIAMFVIHSEFGLPLRHLKHALGVKRKAALDPNDFGALAGVVQAIENIRQPSESAITDPLIDATTGFGAEETAAQIYEQTRAQKEEVYAVLLSVNYAAEYVKAFGRANQAVIKKLVGQVLDAALPKTAPRAVVDDFVFLTTLGQKEFRAVADHLQRKFNNSILSLYELGQGKQVPIQTISIFAISSRYPGATTSGEAAEQFRSRWSLAIESHRGGWAILDADGNVENASGSIQAASSFDVNRKEEPSGSVTVQEAVERAVESAKSPGPSVAAAPKATLSEPMDPALARKMFIVKLCRLSGVKPRLAAQVYSAGWNKPDLLLQTKIHELTERAGMASQEAADLIANLRKHPKETLSYGEDDYRDVFMTDIRMIRKISKESLMRWFQAGYRRMEDLRRTSSQELVKIDRTVPAEDIEAVLSSVRGSSAK